MNYNPARGGHAPGRLRDWLYDLIDDQDRDPEKPDDLDVRWLTGQLWNCTDQAPNDVLRAVLDDDFRGHTVASLARWLRRHHETTKLTSLGRVHINA